MALTIATNSRRMGRSRLAVWSLGFALGGGVLASVAAIAGAIVPPSWYLEDVGPSAAMPALALVARTFLVMSLGACAAALVIGIIALTRGQRVWQAVLAVLTVAALYPTVGAVYFVLSLFLYD